MLIYFFLLYNTTLCITLAVVIAAKSHDIDFLYFNIHLQPSVKLQLSLGVDSYNRPPTHKVQSVQSFSSYQRYIKLLSQCEYTHTHKILLRSDRNDRCLCRKVVCVEEWRKAYVFTIGFSLIIQTISNIIEIIKESRG